MRRLAVSRKACAAAMVLFLGTRANARQEIMPLRDEEAAALPDGPLPRAQFFRPPSAGMERHGGRRGRGNKHRVMYDAPETQAQAQPSQKSVFSRLGLANGGGELAPTACDGSSE